MTKSVGTEETCRDRFMKRKGSEKWRERLGSDLNENTFGMRFRMIHMEGVGAELPFETSMGTLLLARPLNGLLCTLVSLQTY